MSQPSLQLVGVRPGCLGQLEGEGVPQIVRLQRRDVAGDILQLSVMPPPDLRQDQVDRPWGESAIRCSLRDPGRTEEEGCGLSCTSARTFPFELVGEYQTRIIGQENGPFGVPLALDTGDPSLPRLSQRGRGVRTDLVEVEADQFLAPQSGREQYVDHRAIPQRPAGGADGDGDIPPCPALATQLVEAFQPVAEILQTAHLRFGEGARFERRQAEFTDHLGGITDR